MIHNISRFIAALALLATAQGAWAQSTETLGQYTFTVGTDDEGSYYAVDCEEALIGLSIYIVYDRASGKRFKQTADITMTGAKFNNSYFVPIGKGDNSYFSGTYDGGGHTISGLNVSHDTYAGLFGRVHGANLHDIVLVSPTVATTTTSANTYVGPIVAFTKESSTQVSNCTVINPTVTLPGGFNGNAGAIVGKIYDGRFSNCHFYGGNQNDAIGDNFGNTVTNVSRVYTLTATGCTATATPTVTVGTTSYYNSGTAVSLGHDAPADGYIFSDYASDDVTITDGAFTMPAADVAVAATFTPDPAHFSVNDAGTEYTIKTATGWNVFCDCLQDNDTYNRFSGKTVRLGADITVTRMAGSDHHDFCGTFDGGGNTLTVTLSGSSDRMAPFSYISNEGSAPAAIRNLNVVADITSSGQKASALVGEAWGKLTIEQCTVSGTVAVSKQFAGGIIGSASNTPLNISNCISSVTITSTISGDGTHGGFAGRVPSSATLNISGCVFDGKIITTSGTTNCGGFVGHSEHAAGSNVSITNSLYAPTADDQTVSEGCETFCRNIADGHITNSYYTRALGTAQGHATRTVAAAADVTIDAVALTGTATQYTVSGITAYSGGGLQRGETLYYGSGDQLSLTLSNTAAPAPRGYQYGYTASAGTLSGTTLTMPDEDVTISVNTADLAPIDWATVNLGNSKDPYMIYNKDQLLLLAHRVNGTNGETANTYEDKYFKLGADITFTHPANEGDDYAENYEAIGGNYNSTYRPFNGKFDGDGYTVSGIRIRKDGSVAANGNQGLFGRIASGADIHDVHLTDARIIGYMNVGGIAGFNNGGYISGCSVTDSYITATGNANYGTICGRTASTIRLSNNYYHGCTVNGTAVTSGMGCNGADITDYNGALPAYRLDLGANITTPPGTFADQEEWLDTPPVSPRLAPENGFTLAGNHYFASGYVFTPGSTLASGAAQGYTPRATLGDQLLAPYTPTVDPDPLAGKAIAQFTVTADCDGKTLASTEAIYSTRQPVTVAYINADGTPGEASAIALDGTETSLAEGWYFVGKDISYNATVNLTGNVTLILKDGCTMNVGESGSEVDGYGIKCYDEANDTYYDLTICGQTAQTGTISVYTTGQYHYAIGTRHITVNGGNVIAHTDGSACGIDTKRSGNVTINRGSVSATTTDTGRWAWAISANGNLTINGGNVSAKSNSHAIQAEGNVAINGGTVNATGGDGGYSGIYSNGTIEINGGNVTASSIYSDGTAITLGWTNPTDRITASSISTYDGIVAVADGQALTDGSGHIYTGTLTADDLAALAGKTLSGTTEVTLTEDNATQALAAINGISGISVTFNRAFTASKPSTICLPFDYTKNEGDGSFYAFTSIEYSGSEYIATMTEPGTTTLTANTPYLYLPSATGNVEFSGTPTTAIAAGTTTSGDWTFQGTYDEVKWDTAPTGIYGFSAQDVSDQGISQGEFVKVGAKVRIRPLRAYLKYKNGTENYSAARTRGTTAELPDRIIVRLKGSDGNTTAIGTLDTRTGEVEIDTWYDLNGRKLAAKPTQRGIYINNGRKVVIK